MQYNKGLPQIYNSPPPPMNSAPFYTCQTQYNDFPADFTYSTVENISPYRPIPSPFYIPPQSQDFLNQSINSGPTSIPYPQQQQQIPSNLSYSPFQNNPSANYYYGSPSQYQRNPFQQQFASPVQPLNQNLFQQNSNHKQPFRPPSSSFKAQIQTQLPSYGVKDTLNKQNSFVNSHPFEIKQEPQKILPQNVTNSKDPAIQEKRKYMNPILFGNSAKRSQSDNTRSNNLNQPQPQVYGIDKGVLGKVLSDQIEEKKKREKEEKEQNRLQELNMLNYNLNNSPFSKHQLQRQDNLIKKLRESSPRQLPQIVPANKSPQQQQQQYYQKQQQYQYQQQQQLFNQQQYQQQQYIMENSPPPQIFYLNNQMPLDARSYNQIEYRKRFDNSSSRKGKFINTKIEPEDRGSEDQSKQDYHNYLQQQIEETKTKKKQLKEQERLEDQRLMKEYDHLQKIKSMRDEQEIQNKKRKQTNTAAPILDIPQEVTKKQEQQQQQQLKEKMQKKEEIFSEEESFISEERDIKIPIKYDQREFKEEDSSEQSLSEFESTPKEARISETQNIVQFEKEMSSMINMLSENQVRIQQVLSSIKTQSEQSNVQNQMQFTRIQELLKGKLNLSSIDQTNTVLQE